MKKLLGVLFCALVALLCGCGNGEKVERYDKTLKEAYKTVKDMNMESKYLADLAATEWRMDLSSGKDPNDSMEEFFGSGAGKVFADGIKLDKQRIDSINKILSDTPDERKDSYNDFVSLVSEVTAYADLATNPSGNLFQYSNSVAEYKLKCTQLIEQFSLKYSSILTNKKK